MVNNNVKRFKKQAIIGFIFLIFLIGGQFYPILGLMIPACMLFGIGIAFSNGRKWCDWYCPRGCFYDSMLKFTSPQRKIPSFFKIMPLRLAILSFLITIMTLQTIKYWPDPVQIGKVFMVILTTTTVIGIILGLIFHQRNWCYLCPIGTMTNLFGKNKYPLKFNSNNCVNCKLCAKACPMQIEPNVSLSDDCLKCKTCVNVCPQKALNL